MQFRIHSVDQNGVCLGLEGIGPKHPAWKRGENQGKSGQTGRYCAISLHRKKTRFTCGNLTEPSVSEVRRIGDASFFGPSSLCHWTKPMLI
jgi:hypothetical protein